MSEEQDFDPEEDRMIYIGGVTACFYCDCGCKVFRQIDVKENGNPIYRCNSCRIRHEGTPNDATS